MSGHDLIGLIQNIAVVLAFFLIGNRLYPSMIHWNVHLARAVFGLLFGAAGILSMSMPLYTGEKTPMTLETVVAALSAWLGGPLSGWLTAVGMIAFRIGLGGSGAEIGSLAIASAAVIGIVYRRFRPVDLRQPVRPVHPLALGFLVALSGMFWTWLPPAVMPAVLPAGTAHNPTLYAIPIYPLASFLFHYFMKAEWSRKRQFAIDDATGLVEFQHLRQQLARKIAGGIPFYLALVDVNGYKNIHAVSCEKTKRELLKQVGERLSGWIPAHGHVSRVEDEDFVIVLSYPDEPKLPFVGAEYWEDMLSMLGSPYWINNRLYPVSFSLGYTTFEGEKTTVEQLLPNAYAALRQAKESGVGQAARYRERLSEQIIRRSSMEVHIRSAVALNQLKLLYQPRYELETGSLRGFEAWPSWNHPELGTIEANEFLSLAEETNAMPAIGEWMLRQACLALAHSCPRTAKLTVSVGVSGSELRNEGFPELVLRILNETGLAPERLELQLQERALEGKIDEMEQPLRRLHAIGVGLSLDGFGTASSSLAFIRGLPFRLVKLDPVFFRDGRMSRQKEISGPILKFYKELRFDVVATGLETYEQLAFLKKNRCDFAQGSLFGRPLESERLADLVSNAS